MSHLADFNLAVAAIGAACLVAMGLLIHYAPRWRPRVQATDQPTTCANSLAQQQHRKDAEL
ncbi:hypothetical protein [Streptomyces lunaelactis]|uniref:hypothetical protein n=1 Tax=Streptomyces lunaelactis TaxID=1535768 RepID=UPI0015846BC7|nr:hypothetical protein [Streptomyces lunaelactis]NUL13257.1 hypothetical protein [Streptomyces lunaelactis]